MYEWCRQNLIASSVHMTMRRGKRISFHFVHCYLVDERFDLSRHNCATSFKLYVFSIAFDSSSAPLVQSSSIKSHIPYFKHYLSSTINLPLITHKFYELKSTDNSSETSLEGNYPCSLMMINRTGEIEIYGQTKYQAHSDAEKASWTTKGDLPKVSSRQEGTDLLKGFRGGPLEPLQFSKEFLRPVSVRVWFATWEESDCSNELEMYWAWLNPTPGFRVPEALLIWFCSRDWRESCDVPDARLVPESQTGHLDERGTENLIRSI